MSLRGQNRPKFYNKNKTNPILCPGILAANHGPFAFGENSKKALLKYVKLSRTKNEIERKYNQLLEEYKNLKKRLDQIQEENSKKQKVQDQFNQDIDELGRETESLVEEIEKWQT